MDGIVATQSLYVRDGSDSDLAGRNREVRFTPGQQTSMIAGSKSVSCQQETHAPQQTVPHSPGVAGAGGKFTT